MSVGDAIAYFASGGTDAGEFTVTRTAAGSRTKGHYTPGASSTLSIVASVQPAGGRSLADLPEAQRGDEIRTLFTTTELKTRSPATEADHVAIGGEDWEVVKVERFDAWGDTHYRCTIARVSAP